jgi:Fibronectin type III domain
MAATHPLTVGQPSESSGVLAGHPKAPILTALLAAAVAVALLLLYALWEFWPTAATLKSEAASPVNFLGIHRSVTPDVRLFIVVALAGALGGLMHSTRSFAWYVGHEALRWRWLPYYIATLVIGAGLATIVYVVIRGGLFNGKTATTDVNPYGFVAVAAIVGLFTEQALEMLRRVASDFFAAAPQGADNVSASIAAERAKEGATKEVAAPVAETGAAGGVAASTATLAGRLTPNGAVTTYSFEYGQTADYGLRTSDATSSENAPIEVSAAVGDLQPGTEYHFRLVAENAGGAVQGPDSTFTTAAA